MLLGGKKNERKKNGRKKKLQVREKIRSGLQCGQQWGMKGGRCYPGIFITLICPTGGECSINMVIAPQTIASVEEWRSSTVYAFLSLGEQLGDPQWNDTSAGDEESKVMGVRRP